jgi:hypothetical protein
MNGVSADGPALYCTGMGYLPWKADDGETLLVKCYYSEEAADTIVSPTDVVINHTEDFHAWGQYCNIDTGEGRVEFHRRDGSNPLIYSLTASNGLWFHDGTGTTIEDYSHQPIIKRLNSAAQYELFHQRFGHPGERTMKQLHHFIDDVPILKGNAFYKCPSCMHTKCKQRKHTNQLPKYNEGNS